MKIIIYKPWHRWAFIAAIILAMASWAIALYYWDKLPAVIPTHFGLSGQADDWSNKSVWYAFMIPFLQSVMLIGFGFLYHKPKFTNMPTTMLLDALEQPKREHAFKLIRTMLVITTLFIGVFFTYLTFGMNYSALHENVGLIPQIMIAWIVILFAWLIWYNIKVYRLTKQFLAKSKH